MASILKVRDADGTVHEIYSIQGKSAYQYAQDGGYTGTEAEFAEKMAAEIPTVDSTLTKSGQAADAAAVGDRLSVLSEDETISLLIEEDVLPAVHNADGKILADQNGNIVLRY